MKHKCIEFSKGKEKESEVGISGVDKMCSHLFLLAHRFPVRAYLRKLGHLYGLPLVLCAAVPCHGQIGGKTSADGPFIIDDVEDRNIRSENLGRDWIPDYVVGGSFSAVSLSGDSTLLPGQTPAGALEYRIPTAAKGGYVDQSFGIPMPSVPGGSTLSFPGDITSFTHFSFTVRYSHLLPNSLNWIILETYPGEPFPQIYWSYDVLTTNTWQQVTLPLREPIQVDNAGTHTLEELLGQTRFLSFYFFGGPQRDITFKVNVDDIQLTGISAVNDWTLY